MFFCKYNDPIYVKMEKLEIMIMLASERNIEQVLLEFKEYATEVDVEFVRKSVRAIGRCAIKLEKAAERCIQVLLDLIQTKVNYVVQEAIIVIKDIFRKYPNRYESIIATLCANLESLDEPEAKASMIWIIGEYAERIDNADGSLSLSLFLYIISINLIIYRVVGLFPRELQGREHSSAVAIAHCHCQAFLEETHRHPGHGPNRPQLGYPRERQPRYAFLL